MTAAKTLVHWQRAAAWAVEGMCFLPYAVALPLSLWLSTQPSGMVLSMALALVYGGVKAPLRLWRVAVYRRLCREEDALPSLSLPRGLCAAVGWRWQLWWRRAVTLAVAAAPSALLWGYGSVRGGAVGTQPLLWLLLGGLCLCGGLLGAVVWQSRYVLAPYYVLDGYPAAAALSLSVKRMRRHSGEYINFLGAEAPRLFLCLALIPAVWCLPAFRRRQTALVVKWL